MHAHTAPHVTEVSILHMYVLCVICTKSHWEFLFYYVGRLRTRTFNMYYQYSVLIPSDNSNFELLWIRAETCSLNLLISAARKDVG